MYSTKVQCKAKVVPVLNYVPRREDVWRSGGIVPCIPILGPRWRWVVSFTNRSLSPGTHSIGAKNGSEEEHFCSCRESNPCRPGRSSVTILHCI